MLNEPAEEEALVRLARQGDERAFTRLLELLTPRVMLPIISRLVRNSEDARDVLQEVYIQLYKSLPRFQGHASIATFTYRLVENVCRNSYQRQRRLPQPFTELANAEEGHSFLEDIPDATYEPHAASEQREREQLLREAILAIPEKYRTVFILADIEGRSYQEIAELLALNEGTVKSRLNRARRRLQHIVLARRELFEAIGILTYQR